VAAPAGTTNISVVAVVDETGAEISPPLALESITWAEVPEPGWRFVPVIVMVAPIALDGGLKLVILGAGKFDTVRLADPAIELLGTLA
jgi:hypothetical protein